MELLRSLPILLAVAAIAASSALLAGQAVQDVPATTYQVNPVTEKPSPPLPFPPGRWARTPVLPIEFRSPDQMTEKDAEVEADGESSIRERVNFVGLEFNQGKWSYQQIVCPVFPKHVLLKFTRNNGKGDESVFTASIPRMGEGRVRIIPILRRGYSLFSPAPINALTISAFNHIRAEEHPSYPPDWLATGMCYAALAGAHPQVSLIVDSTEAEKFSSGAAATLEIPVEGGALVRFLDLAARPQPMQWTMIFDKKGKLLKAEHTAAPARLPKGLPATLIDLPGTPLPPTVDVSGQSQP